VAYIGRPVADAATTPSIPLQNPIKDLLGTTRGRFVALGIGLVILALLVGVTMRVVNRPGVPVVGANGSSVPLVSVVIPTTQPVTSTVSFTGTIGARYDMPIGAEGEGGRITAVYVEAGDQVKRGQILAKLDDSVIKPQLVRLAASLEEAKADSALADAEYKRAKGVESSGALSAEETERRRAAAETAGARVKVAAAQLAETQAHLSRTYIRAPTDGMVLTRKAEVGQMAMAGSDALFRLAAGGEIEMRGQVAEQDLAALSVGQLADIHLTGISDTFKGKVRLLGAVIDPQSRLGDIRVSLPPATVLRPGAFARGEVTVGNAKRAVLPQSAVLSDAKGTYVFVVDANNKVERRAIRVSTTVDAGFVVSDGLKGDERVISTAGGFLREGEKVEASVVKAGV
jgi:RND family efflux transporter MFP subunit